MTLPPINTVQAFLAVVDLGRFHKAAEALSITESAVSHQIRKLEEVLGMRLMDRGRNGPVLTKAGERFYQKASVAVKQLEEAVQELRTDSRECITLTLPPSLATLWLAPTLWSFYERNRQVEVSILSTLRVCDLEKERIDFGIRLVAYPNWRGCEWLPLWEEYTYPVMAPKVAEDLQAKGWDYLVNNTWLIENELHPEEWRNWCKQFGLCLPPAANRKKLNSFDYVVNAALSGQGIAMGRNPMVDALLLEGRLVAPFGEQFKLPTGKRYYAVWPSHTGRYGMKQEFLNWLRTIKST